MEGKRYDIFISYVVEDREMVERIVKVLESYDLKVWYAKYELYPGAEIRRLINEGLARSQYGVAIMSPLYHGPWPHGELFYMLQRPGMLIPLLHEQGLEQVEKEHPEIRTLYCLNTEEGVELAATRIADQVIASKKEGRRWKSRLLGTGVKGPMLRLSLAGILLLTALYLFLHFKTDERPSDELLEAHITYRETMIKARENFEYQRDSIIYNHFPGTLAEVIKTESAYLDKTGSYRNYVDYFTQNEHIKTFAALKKQAVFPAGEDVEAPYGLTQYMLLLFRELPGKTEGFGYSLLNKLPLMHEIKATRSNDGHFEVDIQYSNHLRYAFVTLEIDTAENRRIRHLRFIGLKPRETFVFKKQGESWDLVEIR